MYQFNSSEFYRNETLEDMKLNEKISMKDIYEEIKKVNICNKSEIELFIKNEKINIRYITSNKFDIDDILENLFLNPIEMKIEMNSELHKINIIGMDHYNNICEKYKIINPRIYCDTCKHYFAVNENVKKHLKHDIYIKEIHVLKSLNKNEFNNYFKNDTDCFQKTYSSPKDFDKNFKYYFSHYSIYKNRPFKLYNDSKRKKFIHELLDTEKFIGHISSYFGKPKIGKSISVIAITKYIMNHSSNGILYLNLKCLYKLFEKYNYNKLKEIIFDEIPYLFFNKYDDYLECYNLIDHHHFSNDDTIWNFIRIIFEFVYKLIDKSNDERKYIFILDQYNEKIDSNNELYLLFQNYIINSLKKRIGIITFSSMNNSDIKMYKINLINKLFDKSRVNNSNNYNFIEIEDILESETLKFDKNENNEYYHYLGKNIKNYNILKYYEEENKNIVEYIDNERYKIEQNIKNYFDWTKDESNLIKILYFSTETKYDIKQFNIISEYIPFKYFFIEIEEKYINIKFASTLVEEVVSFLYEYIIYRKFILYNECISNKLIDENAKREFFKKYVTYYLNPYTIGTNKNHYFQDIKIEYLEKMKKFVPRNDDINIEKPLEDKKELIPGVYLFVQTILGRRDFDLLIIDINEKNIAKIIAIQISIHIENNKIFNENSLKSSFKKLIENLNNNYNFKIHKDEIYFTYIFDSSFKKIQNKKFNQMLSQCNLNKMRYIFFDTEKNEFINDKGNKIKNLIENTISPFTKIKRSYQEIENSENKNILKKIFTKPLKYFPLSESEKSLILDTIREENSEDIINLEYLECKVIFDKKNLESNKIYVGKCKDKDIIYAIYYSKKSGNFKTLSINPPLILLGDEFFHIFDIYNKVIKFSLK